jgi:hypothetical protein
MLPETGKAGSKKQLVKSANPTFVSPLARLDELTDEQAALGSGSSIRPE